MREHDLQPPHRVGRAHGPKVHDGTITTEVPDVMWGTDMTATMTVGEGAAFVFVAVDHLPCRPTSDPGGPGLRRLYGLFSGWGVAGASQPCGRFIKENTQGWCPFHH